MVIIDVPAPVAAVFSFGQELGEPDWRCTKTCDGLLLSIRWNSRISASTTTENVTTHNRQRKLPNSRQRRSRRRMESFLARKRATVNQEAADGLSCRTPDREHPRKQLQDSTPSNPLLSQDQEPAGLHLLDLEKPSFLRNLDRPRSKEEDGDENDKGNDAMLRHSSDTGSVHPSTLTPAESFWNLAHVKPDSPRLREKIIRAELLLGVDLVESMRREFVDEIRQGLGLRHCTVETVHTPDPELSSPQRKKTKKP